MAGQVTGIGGIFFKARDPAALKAWYQEHLGLPELGRSGVAFEASGQTIWSPFTQDTDYFAPSDATFMINFRVDDLDALSAKLEAAGIAVERKTEDDPHGRFAWVIDPEGNKIELWEPPAES